MCELRAYLTPIFKVFHVTHGNVNEMSYLETADYIVVINISYDQSLLHQKRGTVPNTVYCYDKTVRKNTVLITYSSVISDFGL